jgi:outer membrane murein-binding lipoprotein Lpp
MNLLGRLFIVLIFIGSVMFMSLSVVLYATHTNWREQAVKLDGDLKKKTQDLAELQRAKDAMETALRLEIRIQANRNVTLKTTVDQLAQDNEDAKAELADLKGELTAQVAAVKAAHETTERLRVRLDETSKKLLVAQSDWMDMSTQLVSKIDEAHGLATQLANYQSASSLLAKDYRDAMEVLRINGLTGDPALYASHPPVGIRGTVTEVRPRGVVEISVGADSGLIKGHHLDVIRNREGRSAYIGKIEITDVVADRAVARVMPEFRRGVVQLGDEITYIDVNEVVAN